MCGIVGYVGPREALPILMDGLRRLEYRGYDSAGVAVQHDGHLEVRRAEGKLDNLVAVVSAQPASGHTGLGHTRWATHGRPTEQNAHPHVDCGRVTAVIHNGIIENFEELKGPLVAKGHVFTSDTDTEVVVHLVEDELAAGCSIEDAALAVVPRLEGAAALGFVSAKDPGKLVAARISNAGGVIVGYGDGENYLASDIPALLEHTRTVSYLEPGELVLVTAASVRFLRFDGTAVEKERRTITWDPIAAAKSGYKHFMLKEIFEQPRTISDTLLGRSPDDRTRRLRRDLRMDEASFDIPAIASSAGPRTTRRRGKYLVERGAHPVRRRDRDSTGAAIGGGARAARPRSRSRGTADTLAAMEEAKARRASSRS